MGRTPLRRLLAAFGLAAVLGGGLAAPSAAQAATTPVTAVHAAPGAQTKAKPGSLAAQRTALKGLPPRDPASPAGKRARAQARLLSCTTCYTYAGGIFVTPAGVTASGAGATMVVPKPYAHPATTYHTLVEIAVENYAVGTARQIVEIGVTGVNVVNGDYDPHLFGYTWVNGVGQGYNASNAGWVDYSGNAIDLGANLATTAAATFPANAKAFLIQYDTSTSCGSASAGWWLAYAGSWVGCFKDTQWTGAGVSGFTYPTQTQWFDEVASTTATPCADAGNGKQGSAGTLPLDASDPSYIGSASLINASPATTVDLSLYADDSTKYSTLGFPSGSPSKTRTFTVGGPGWNSAGTATGSTGSC